METTLGTIHLLKMPIESKCQLTLLGVSQNSIKKTPIDSAGGLNVQQMPTMLISTMCVSIVGNIPDSLVCLWDWKGDSHTHTHTLTQSHFQLSEWRVRVGLFHFPGGFQVPWEISGAGISGCNRPHPRLSLLWWTMPALLCSQSMDDAQFQTPHHTVDNTYSWLCRFIQSRPRPLLYTQQLHDWHSWLDTALPLCCIYIHIYMYIHTYIFIWCLNSLKAVFMSLW